MTSIPLTNTSIETQLQDFPTMTLEETGKVRLMRRTDTKYVVRAAELPRLLDLIREGYAVQVNNSGERQSLYRTTYYDTPRHEMFYEHVLGRAVRDKVRVREYTDTQEKFLEVKHKDNHGKTNKRRVHPEERELLNVPYDNQLMPHLANSFHRITLVSRQMTERVTIDTDLTFYSLLTGADISLTSLAIIEIKRDGMAYSLMHDTLLRNHIHPSGFSKYCIGMAMTNPNLRINNLKQKLHTINKLCMTL